MEATAFIPLHLAEGCLAPPDLPSVPSPAFLPVMLLRLRRCQQSKGFPSW